MKKKQRVYDLPTRLFHWLFAALFLGAFFIAKTFDDDSPTYPYHMLLGLTLCSAVILRILWGFIGSHYARFSSFSLSPKSVFKYFLDLLTSKTTRELGHNPASSWAAMVMMLCGLGLGATGLMMTNGVLKEVTEEVHEVLANAFILTAIAHVLGVAVHMFRHRDGIAFSMIHGKKDAIEGAAEIKRWHVLEGIVFLCAVAGVLYGLNSRFNPATGQLDLFGKQIQLGETDSENGSEHGSKGKEQDTEE